MVGFERARHRLRGLGPALGPLLPVHRPLAHQRFGRMVITRPAWAVLGLTVLLVGCSSAAPPTPLIIYVTPPPVETPQPSPTVVPALLKADHMGYSAKVVLGSAGVKLPGGYERSIASEQVVSVSIRNDGGTSDYVWFRVRGVPWAEAVASDPAAIIFQATPPKGTADLFFRFDPIASGATQTYTMRFNATAGTGSVPLELALLTGGPGPIGPADGDYGLTGVFRWNTPYEIVQH